MSNNPPVAAAAVETPAVAPVAAFVPPAYSGLADGGLGANLNDKDKLVANKAEAAALASGERRTWRGDDGSYGYIVPAANGGASSANSGGDCRDFVHTVYINGRPKVGNGSACRLGDSWKLS